MDSVLFRDLTDDEIQTVSGGMTAFGCALVGGFTMAAFVAGQWWAVAGGLLAAYNGGCFD
jgi:hypothetical protein